MIMDTGSPLNNLTKFSINIIPELMPHMAVKLTPLIPCGGSCVFLVGLSSVTVAVAADIIRPHEADEGVYPIPS